MLAALVSVMGVSALAGGATPHDSTSWTPVYGSDFPDPSVMAYNGVYYGYSTQNFPENGAPYVNIQTATSTDGINWSGQSDALPNLPSWAAPVSNPPPYRNTWAPSVRFNGSEFVMYYTATDTQSGSAFGDQCIGMATSISPSGPFADDSSTPVVCDPTQGGDIDPDIFIQTLGGTTTQTLIWKNDGNHNSTSVYIWSEPLTPSLTSFGTSSGPVAILGADQPSWQGGIVEGPDMVNVGGADYLFYSGNAESSVSYAIGYATCFDGPSEPCTDGNQNPILTSAVGMSGPGGPTVFTSTSGHLLMAFSGWSGTNTNYFAGGYRPMFLANLTFSEGVPVLTPANAPVVTPPPPPAPGYWQVASDGGIFTFGAAQFYGSTGALHLNKPVVAMSVTPDGRGYWLVASDGGIFAFGDAKFAGSTGAIHLNKPIVGMSTTPDGQGYWLVASDGGIFAFGDATFWGSTGANAANLFYPIVGMTPTVGGGGYWFVDSNGDIFSYGDAKNYGQPTAAPGGYHITGMAGTINSGGYWLADSNGSLGTYGDAEFYGDPYGKGLNGSIVGIAATPDGNGYWLQGSDGGIFNYGDAQFFGSMGGDRLNAPMVGIAAD